MPILSEQNEVLQMEVEEEQESIMKKKKKCHGNLKLHHFKRKWRKRGKTEEEINELINLRNDNGSDDGNSTITTTTNNNNNNNNNDNNNNQVNKIKNNRTLQNNRNKIQKKKKKQQQKNKKRLNKRKRSQQNNEGFNTTIRSISQLSISQQQPLSKKRKINAKEEMNTTTTTTTIAAAVVPVFVNNKPVISKYLRMPRKLLLHSLRLQLNHPIKNKKEKTFILSRLKLLDEQFCIGMDQYLYQSYLPDGSHCKIWPDDIINMTQMNNYDQIEKFLKEYLIRLQQKFDSCTEQLLSQALSCPTSMKLLLIESQLKEFVRLHHLDLTRKVNFQINHFKDQLREKELFLQLSSDSLSSEQQQTIQRLRDLRQQQFERFEEMTKLEVRILSRILPKFINELDQLIPSSNQIFSNHSISPVNINNNNNSNNDNNNNNNSLYEIIKKHQKWLRDYKRELLAKELEKYETTIEQYEFLYQKELLNCLYKYLHIHATNKIREIRFNETIFRYRLLHPHHRRSSLTNNNNRISIYPEAIIEIFEKLFTKNELDLLSSLGGPSYIRLNQTSVHKKKKVEKKVQRQHTTVMDKLAADLHHKHGLPPKSTIIKQFSNQLEIMFHQQFSTSSLSYHDIHRTRKDHFIVLLSRE